ncbi:MAG: hypothetical protein ACP5KU_07455 [Candidatus Bathyarchaeia archaeon]
MSEDTVKTVLIRRIEGIKKKDAQSIADLVDKDRYTKFDDWPPFERQGLDALNREAEALKVLKEYDYEISEWKVDVINNVAIALRVFAENAAFQGCTIWVHLQGL